MGLLKKLLAGADRVYDAKTDLELAIFRDRRYGRAEALAAAGDPTTAVVTGIRRRFDGDASTHTEVRLEWYSPEPRVGGVHYGMEMPLAIRLGSTLAVRTDGDRVAVDPAAMAGVPGAPTDAGRTSRKAPERGLDDSALNSSVLSRIEKWTPADATVLSFERLDVLGVASLNWHIDVDCNGTRARVAQDFVPSYARWYVAPGAVVPVVVDPKDPTRAQVNWPELAERRAEAGGTWQDDPPAGSIAETLLRVDPAATEVSGLSAGEPLDLTPSAEAVEAVEGITLERYAWIEAALVKDRVPPAQYDAYAASLGAPAGRWEAVKAEWQRRTTADWRVGAAFGEAFEAARKELKKKR